MSTRAAGDGPGSPQSWVATLAGIAMLLCLLFRAADSQAAAPFYVSLRYEVADSTPGCWDEAELRRTVAQAVGYDPFRDGAAFTVAVYVSGTERQINGQVEWHDERGARMGDRNFVAKDGSCEKLLTELCFAVGFQIELLRPKPSSGPAAAKADGSSSSSTTTGATSTGSPESKPAQPVSAKTQPATAAAAEPSSDESTAIRSDAPWRFWAGAGPSAAFGLAPSVTGQARLFLGARRADLSLELGAEGTLPVVEREANGDGFRQLLLGGSAAFCGHLRAFSACVLGKASSLMVEGRGVDQRGSPATLVAHAGARVGITHELSKTWLLTPHVDALVLLTPSRVTLNGVGVWDMPPLALLAGMDLVVRLQ